MQTFAYSNDIYLINYTYINQAILQSQKALILKKQELLVKVSYGGIPGLSITKN